MRFPPNIRLDPSQVQDLRAGGRTWQDFQRLLKMMQANVYQAQHPNTRIVRYEDGSFRRPLGARAHLRKAESIYDRLMQLLAEADYHHRGDRR